MPNQFILDEIVSRIVTINQDYFKHKRYKANLKTNNDENNIYHIITFANINNSGIFCGCIYIDINELGEILYLKKISVIHNFSTNYLAYENTS